MHNVHTSNNNFFYLIFHSKRNYPVAQNKNPQAQIYSHTPTHSKTYIPTRTHEGIKVFSSDICCLDDAYTCQHDEEKKFGSVCKTCCCRVTDLGLELGK